MTSSKPPGAVLAATMTATPAFGFVPVAIHFDLFATLVQIGKAATAEEVTKACNERDSAKGKPSLSLLLAQDTLYSLVALGLVDLVEDDDVYQANAITRHMVDFPSAQHGALHFTTEALLAGAFLMRKLIDTNFAYPFKDADTPMQYAHKLMGDEKLAKEHTYSIMELQGRMESFDEFMVGKFVKHGKMPGRVKRQGYDLDAAISGNESPIAMVDIGGGQGELLLEMKEAYPHLPASSLILQEFHVERLDMIPGVTAMEWDFKRPNSEQPVQGALTYSMSHILHNLPDLDALELMQKVSRAMVPHSRLLINEYTKNENGARMHAAMIALYGGRLRSNAEWEKMAALCGLKVTFGAYPETGDGLVEMRKV